jgi:hypothetical protein
MQAASDDVTDDRIVWTCCKNNDDELGKRSACPVAFNRLHDNNRTFNKCPQGQIALSSFQQALPKWTKVVGWNGFSPGSFV